MYLDYLKNRIWKWLLCTLMTGSFCLCINQGFNISDSLADSIPAAFALAAVLQAALLLAGFNKKTIIAGIGGFIGLIIAGSLIIKATGAVLSDEPGNPGNVYIFFITGILSAVIIHLLGSWRIGTALMFPLGTIIIAAMHFLQFDAMPICFMIFFISNLILFIMLDYNKSAMESGMRQPSFKSCFGSGSINAGVALLLSSLLFFGIIAPMNPKVHDLQLLTKHITLDLLDVVGVTDHYDTEYQNPVDDPEQTNDDINETLDGDLQDDQKTEEITEDQGSGDKEIEAHAITYDRERHIIRWLILLLILILCSLPVLKIYLKKRQLEKIYALEPKLQMETGYLYLVRRFEILGFFRNNDESPYEYEARYKTQLQRYDISEGMFATLTDNYVRSRYGGMTPTAEDCEQIKNGIEGFYKKCKDNLGITKYLLKWFRL